MDRPPPLTDEEVMAVAVRRRRNRGLTRPHRRLPILIRDQQRCRYCGLELDPFAGEGSPLQLTLDHVIPLVLGGTNRAENVVVACLPCNLRKRDMLPLEAGMRLRPAPGTLVRIPPKTHRQKPLTRS
jgi:5-methylcytosine-specific restriction endonuclease McrA